MSEESPGSNFSTYGIYEVSDGLELSLPNTEIRIHRVGENAYS